MVVLSFRLVLVPIIPTLLPTLAQTTHGPELEPGSERVPYLWGLDKRCHNRIPMPLVPRLQLHAVRCQLRHRSSVEVVHLHIDASVDGGAIHRLRLVLYAPRTSGITQHSADAANGSVRLGRVLLRQVKNKTTRMQSRGKQQAKHRYEPCIEWRDCSRGKDLTQNVLHGMITNGRRGLRTAWGVASSSDAERCTMSGASVRPPSLLKWYRTRATARGRGLVRLDGRSEPSQGGLERDSDPPQGG